MDQSAIRKITYLERFINPDDLARPHRTIYMLLPDGSERVYEYDYERKAYLICEKVFGATKEDYEGLCKRIDSLIQNATGIYTKIDDTSGTVTIYRESGTVERYDRCFGTEKQIIEEVFSHYYYRYRRQGMRAIRFEKYR